MAMAAAVLGPHLMNLRPKKPFVAAPAGLNNLTNFRTKLVSGRRGGGDLLRRMRAASAAYKVVIEEASGERRELEVEGDETILSRALESGLEVPHDCKLGVCMTCPARLVAGKVDQSDGMLSDDVVERGYALLCSAYPLSDCHIKIIPEEELLSLQLATAND